jgi:hypothetical protein
LSPFFERFFILGGPRGTRQKKLHDLDPIQLEGGPVGFWIKIHLNPNI